MDAAASLRALGLGQHEALVYVHLLQHPLSTGYEVAKATGIPRANVYSVLESLAERSMVQASASPPARYVAAPPDQVVGRIRRQSERLCAVATRELGALQTPSTVSLFWTLNGRERILDQAISMLEAARERVVISAWSEDLTVLEPELRSANSRGAVLVINAFGQYQPGFGSVFQHEDTSRAIGGRLLTLATDFDVAMTASLDDPPAGVYTRQPGLVQLVEKLIRDESYIAEVFSRFQPQLEQVYGPHLIELRSRLLPPHLSRRLADVIGLALDDHQLDNKE
jgi:HTH-type transcriptional regulator, sugar sensing transcriptional regulator